jgi:hypothetical protein
VDLTAPSDPHAAADNRQLRREPRRQVCLSAVLRSPELAQPLTVEIVDLTTGGARVRGAEVPVGSRVTLQFTPPDRERPVSARGVVVHGTHRAQQPWIGVLFHLVAMRGGR